MEYFKALLSVLQSHAHTRVMGGTFWGNHAQRAEKYDKRLGELMFAVDHAVVELDAYIRSRTEGK